MELAPWKVAPPGVNVTRSQYSCSSALAGHMLWQCGDWAGGSKLNCVARVALGGPAGWPGPPRKEFGNWFALLFLSLLLLLPFVSHLLLAAGLRPAAVATAPLWMVTLLRAAAPGLMLCRSSAACAAASCQRATTHRA